VNDRKRPSPKLEQLSQLLASWRDGSRTPEWSIEEARKVISELRKQKRAIDLAPEITRQLVEAAIATGVPLGQVSRVLRAGRARALVADLPWLWALVQAACSGPLASRTKRAERIALLRSALVETWVQPQVGGRGNHASSPGADPLAVASAVAVLRDLSGVGVLDEDPEGAFEQALVAAALALGALPGSNATVAGIAVSVPGTAVPAVIAAPSPPPTAKRAPTPPTEKQLLALRERESDLRELLRHEEDRVRRQATQIAELNADVARLRERTWSQDAELTELRLSLGPLRASADRGAACEVALAALRAEMQVLLSEARSSVVHARSQGAAAALSRCRQLAAAPLSTLRQLAGLVAEDAAQSMGACVDQLVIAMQDPEGSANELRD
jgi:hypothetical protein